MPDEPNRMFAKALEIGDLVWAKMKNFPYWPAKIVSPPENSSPKKAEHYVYFFGSEDHAWIMDANIVPHSEEMINSCKKRRAGLQDAIDEIVKASLEGTSTPKEEKEKVQVPSVENCDDSSKASTASKPKKEKIRKMKPKNAVVRAPKRRASDKSEDSLLSMPPKLPKMLDDVSSVLSTGSTTADGSRIAVIRPFDDASSKVLGSRYVHRPSTPLLDVATVSDNLKTKHVKPTDKKIGFLGLGMMGRGIVKNLLNSGHHVIIWNRSPYRCNDFIKAGAIKALSPMEVVNTADIIFCCVSDSKAVKAVVFGNCGVLQGFEECGTGQKGYVEMSSIDDDTSQEIAEAISIKGGRYLEAPITGNRQLAEEGSLMILGSGDRGLFNDCETCFHAISRHAYYVSCDVGKSSKFNLILSMLMGTVCGALAEALALAKRIRVSQKELLEVLQINGFTSAMVLDKGRAILEKNFTANTPLKHQQKDVNLALSMSDDVGQPMPVSASANELYKHAKLLGYSEHDMAAVYQGVKY